MEQKVEKMSVLVISYDEVKDYRQFKIAILKSFNLNFVNKIYFVEKEEFTEEMKRFCKEFKMDFEAITPLPAKLSNDQSEKLSKVRGLIVFNNGEDKKIKKYETFVKKLPVYISIWKTKNGNLILK